MSTLENTTNFTSSSFLIIILSWRTHYRENHLKLKSFLSHLFILKLFPMIHDYFNVLILVLKQQQQKDIKYI